MKTMDEMARRWAFYVRKVKQYMIYRGMITPRRKRRYNRLTAYRTAMICRSGYNDIRIDGKPPVEPLTFRGELFPELKLGEPARGIVMLDQIIDGLKDGSYQDNDELLILDVSLALRALKKELGITRE